MLKRTLPLLASAFLLTAASGQDSPKRIIEAQIQGLAKGDTVFLANYYGSKLYYNDTAVVDAKANACLLYTSPSPRD